MKTRFERDNDYRYTLNPQERSFETGTAEGSQVLLGLWFPYLVAVFFDSNGDLVSNEQRQLSSDAEALGRCSFHSKEFRHHVMLERALWENELHFVSGPISVKKFSLPYYELAIEDYPSFIREVLADPTNHSVEDAKGAQDLLGIWEEVGQFVFYWTNDYWMNRDGEVVAS
jgi:hypothetical protein